jgi:prevent-host-death family protein
MAISGTNMISIADAKNQFPALVHRAEAGEAVTISRRGKPVAVVVSAELYERAIRQAGAAPSWFDRLNIWRSSLPAELEGLSDAELDAVRDREPYVPRTDFDDDHYADVDAYAMALRAAESESESAEDRKNKPKRGRRA